MWYIGKCKFWYWRYIILLNLPDDVENNEEHAMYFEDAWLNGSFRNYVDCDGPQINLEGRHNHLKEKPTQTYEVVELEVRSRARERQKQWRRTID